MTEQVETTDAVLYEERLWPAAWVWSVLLGVSLVWIVILAPISLAAGYLAAAVLTAILTLLMVLSTPRITVTERTLKIGRARIERRYVGTVEGFAGGAATIQRGTGLDGRAYLCIRGWISPVVRVPITDDADPTPYWLASTRRPKQLAAALNTA